MDTLPGFVTQPSTDFYIPVVRVKSLPNENGLTEGIFLRSIH